MNLCCRLSLPWPPAPIGSLRSSNALGPRGSSDRAPRSTDDIRRPRSTTSSSGLAARCFHPRRRRPPPTIRCWQTSRSPRPCRRALCCPTGRSRRRPSVAGTRCTRQVRAGRSRHRRAAPSERRRALPPTAGTLRCRRSSHPWGGSSLRRGRRRSSLRRSSLRRLTPRPPSRCRRGAPSDRKVRHSATPSPVDLCNSRCWAYRRSSRPQGVRNQRCSCTAAHDRLWGSFRSD